MYNKLILILAILCISQTSAQIWLDKQCKISDEVKSFELEAASKRDVLTLLIDQEGKLLANGKDISFLNETRFKEYVYNFIANPDANPQMAKSPKRAIISVQHYQHPEEYDARLTNVREVYYFLWNLDANEKYKEDYINLDCKKREKIQRKNPYRVFETQKQKKRNDNGPIFSGPPPFEGDVKDN